MQVFLADFRISKTADADGKDDLKLKFLLLSKHQAETLFATTCSAIWHMFRFITPASLDALRAYVGSSRWFSGVREKTGARTMFAVLLTANHFQWSVRVKMIYRIYMFIVKQSLTPR
jgi:hypothetical protein